MTHKQDESHKGQKKRPQVPSTGRGAASAMDALIKRRVTAPGGNSPAPPARSKKH